MSNPWGSQQPFDPESFPPPSGPDQPGPAGYGYPPPPPGPPSDATMPYPYYPPYPGGYPVGYPVAPPQHPQSVTAMVLGILGLVCCGLASPFAVWLGRKSMNEIDASGGQLGGRGQAQAGFILGLVGTAVWVLGLLFYAVLFILGIAASTNQVH